MSAIAGARPADRLVVGADHSVTTRALVSFEPVAAPCLRFTIGVSDV